MSRRTPCRNDPFGIPSCFYWTVDEVADWVESIGYGKYKENFRSHFINGRRLLTVDACALPKMGIVHFGDIMAMASCIKNILGKGPKVPSLVCGPSSHLSQLDEGQMQVTPQSRMDYLCGWKDWMPEFYYRYDEKIHPITRRDFDASWWLSNCSHRSSQPCIAPPHQP